MCKNPAMPDGEEPTDTSDPFAGSPHRGAVLALDGVVGFDLGTPTQVLGSARDSAGRRLYDVRVCGPDGAGRPVRSASGFPVLPDHGLEALAWAQTVVVAGVEGWRTAGPFPVAALEALR